MCSSPKPFPAVTASRSDAAAARSLSRGNPQPRVSLHSFRTNALHPIRTACRHFKVACQAASLDVGSGGQDPPAGRPPSQTSEREPEGEGDQSRIEALLKEVPTLLDSDLRLSPVSSPAAEYPLDMLTSCRLVLKLGSFPKISR